MPKGWLCWSTNVSRDSATPSRSASRSSVMQSGLAPMAPARFIVATIAWPKMVRGAPGLDIASDTVTSPLGSTRIQRGCFNPVAKALTFSPAAAVGAWPGPQPCAVGIFSVEIKPCGLAGGMTGASPMAAVGSVAGRRHQTARSPTMATALAKNPDPLMPCLLKRREIVRPAGAPVGAAASA